MNDRAARGAVLAVSGLLSESRIARANGLNGAPARGLVTVAGGGDSVWLAEAIERHVAAGATALISFGIAGALVAGLRPGALIVANRISVGGASGFGVDAAWSRALIAALPEAVSATIAGSDTVVVTSAQKARLGELSGAVAVDMESQIAAQIAAQHGLPFVALRAIADPLDRSVPAAAAVALLPGGGVAAHKVLLPLLRDPGQLPGMLRVALDARCALRALAQGRRRLGDRLGFVDLDQFALDVV